MLRFDTLEDDKRVVFTMFELDERSAVDIAAELELMSTPKGDPSASPTSLWQTSTAALSEIVADATGVYWATSTSNKPSGTQVARRVYL